jgi:hypothetical protein
LQARSQQKPSTQIPFWQSVATLHGAPIGPAVVHWCVVGLQIGAAAVQSALVVHDARQAVCAALHARLSGQGPDAPGAHVPTPLQNRAVVSVLPLQVCGAQLTVPGANTHAAVAVVTSVH